MSVTLISVSHSRSISPGWGGLCICMSRSSVVLLVIHQHDIAVFELEGEPPWAIDRHGPMTCKVVLERMQPPVGAKV